MLAGGKSWKFSGAVPQELKARIVCGNGGATAVMPCDLACSGQTGALRERRGSPMDNPKVKCYLWDVQRKGSHGHGTIGSPAGHTRPDDSQDPPRPGPTARVWNREAHRAGERGCAEPE